MQNVNNQDTIFYQLAFLVPPMLICVVKHILKSAGGIEN